VTFYFGTNEGDNVGFTMSQLLPEPKSRGVTPAANEYTLNFSTSQFENYPGKSFGLKGHEFIDDTKRVLYNAQEAFEKSSRVRMSPAYSFRPKFPQVRHYLICTLN
jgi:hypothetical protein